jgi:predicted MFS family arabinose efflux permease
VFALAPSFAIAISALFVVGATSSAYSSLNSAMLLANTAPRLYGRVASISFTTHASAPVFALPVAALADRFGGPPTVAAAGALAILFIIAVALISPPQHRRTAMPPARAAVTTLEA